MYAGEEAHIDDVQAEPKQPLRDKSKDQGEELVELKLSLLKEKTIINQYKKSFKYNRYSQSF